MLVMLCVFIDTDAQTRVGMYNSVKGLGASVELVSRDNPTEADIFTLYADTYGVFSGRSGFVGVIGSYSHDYSFIHKDYEFFSIELHSGAGLLGGYARDHESGVFSRNRLPLTKSPGICIAVTGNVGVRFFFDRKISLDLSFTIEPGMHIRTDDVDGHLMISTYNNGLFHFMYPQMRIYYNF